MSLKTLMISALVAYTEARFGQEHPAAIDEISAVTSGGAPGQAATIAGGAISDLLAGANACTKLQTGDKIIASLGTGADAVKAAQDFVAAEKNFNPFAQTVPTICSDPSLPSTAVLRGVLPLIDPAVVGSDVANKLSAQSLTTPFSNAGMSVAQIFAANGFTNFTTQDLSGNTGSASNASGSGGPAASSSSGSSDGAGSSNSTAASSTTDGSTGDAAAGGCGGAPPAAVITTAAPATTFATVVTTAAAVATGSASSSAGSTSGGANLTGTAAQQAAEADPTTGTSAKTSLAGVDFGLCVPTLFFAGGLDNRKATEFTFQAVDPKISAIQEEALNPNIITNRICDELTNQCQSNAQAKTVCQTAKAQISALGTRDQSTADAWNQALGF